MYKQFHPWKEITVEEKIQRLMSQIEFLKTLHNGPIVTAMIAQKEKLIEKMMNGKKNEKNANRKA